jgi:hypothetical protein
MKNQIKILCGALALALAGPVSAATTWTLTAAPAGVTMSAYANTGGTDNAANAANNGALQTIQSATLNSYTGGMGVTNADSCTSGSYCDLSEGVDPEHAIDNNQRYDMVLLSFASLVKLTDVKLGYASIDSDVTVMAYTGTGNPTLTGKLIGKTYNQLVGLGWAAIGNYANVGTSAARSINAGSIFSSYWLIGAYNPLANSSGFVGGASPDSSFDNVKLASVTGCVAGSAGCDPNTVPEPGSLALFGLALLGMLTLRKRQHA